MPMLLQPQKKNGFVLSPRESTAKLEEPIGSRRRAPKTMNNVQLCRLAETAWLPRERTRHGNSVGDSHAFNDDDHDRKKK